MKIYKRGILSLLYSLVLALIGILFINYIVYWLITEKAPDYIWIFYIVLTLSSLFMLYSSIFKENISIEVVNKYLKYYENNKLIVEKDLS